MDNKDLYYSMGFTVVLFFLIFALFIELNNRVYDYNRHFYYDIQQIDYDNLYLDELSRERIMKLEHDVDSLKKIKK